MTVGIIAVLLALFLPHLTKSKRMSNLVIDQANLRQIGQATTMFATDHKDYIPASTLSATQTTFNADNTALGGASYPISGHAIYATGITPPAKSLTARIAAVKNAAGTTVGHTWGLGQLVTTGYITNLRQLFTADPMLERGSYAIPIGPEAYATRNGIISNAATPGIPASGSVSCDYIFQPYANFVTDPVTRVTTAVKGADGYSKHSKASSLKPHSVLAANYATVRNIGGNRPWTQHGVGSGVLSPSWDGSRPIQPFTTNVLYADGHVTGQAGRDYWTAVNGLGLTQYAGSPGYLELHATVLPFFEKNR